MAITVPSTKRGDDWSLVGVYKENGVGVNITNFTIRSQLRDANLNLVCELTVTKSNQTTTPGGFVLSIPVGTDTTTWPTGNLQSDIEFVPAGGRKKSTETFLVPVVEEVTK